MVPIWASSNYAFEYVSSDSGANGPALYLLVGNYLAKYHVTHSPYLFKMTNEWGALLHNGASINMRMIYMDSYRTNVFQIIGAANGSPAVYFFERDEGRYTQVMAFSGAGAINGFSAGADAKESVYCGQVDSQVFIMQFRARVTKWAYSLVGTSGNDVCHGVWYDPTSELYFQLLQAQSTELKASVNNYFDWVVFGWNSVGRIRKGVQISTGVNGLQNTLYNNLNLYNSDLFYFGAYWPSYVSSSAGFTGSHNDFMILKSKLIHHEAIEQQYACSSVPQTQYSTGQLRGIPTTDVTFPTFSNVFPDFSPKNSYY